MRVLIIGAGLGGLTLLHGLRAAGIDARVFERSARDGVQPASYGIHLNADGLAALHASLPADNWALINQAAVPTPNIIRFRDPRRGVIVTIDKQLPQHSTHPITKRRAISRGRLRAALLAGLDREVITKPLVHWEKRFARYDLRGDCVRVDFDDGSHAEGDLLVGADGSNSRVRRQRLPELERQELGILNIAGRVPLTPLLQNSLPTDLTDGGINNIVPVGAGWMFCSTWDTGDPDLADVSHGATRYLVWAWADRRTAYPPALDRLSGDELKTLVLERIQGWDGTLGMIIDQTDPSTIATVPLRTMPQLPTWDASPVTLIGDAIHNMTPMAGIGANTALRDADQLRRALTNAAEPSLLSAVGSYENTMRTYANEALGLSTRNARNAALASAANRRAFRTMLRVADRVPMIKSRMFGPVASSASRASRLVRITRRRSRAGRQGRERRPGAAADPPR